jgi:outer membrane protein assembly factor BamD (BamD/ComL family)
MKKIFGYVFIVFVAITSCNSPKEKALKSLYEKENADSTFSPQAARELKEAYIAYAQQYPDDEQAPIFMFKAAQRCNVMGDHNEAIEILNQIFERYPQETVAEQALMLKAYVYENSLGALAEAEKIYKQFLEKYPNSVMADDAKSALKYLGKSPEEVWDAMNKEGVVDTEN